MFQALAVHPDSEELLKVRAEAYENLKQYDKAVADYHRLTRFDPDDEKFWFLLGRNQFKNGQLQDAMKSLHNATRLNPQYLAAFCLSQPTAGLRPHFRQNRHPVLFRL